MNDGIELKTPAYGRSGYEKTVLRRLEKNQIGFEYEPIKIRYIIEKDYIPDLVLDNGIIIELKGRFDGDDRRKHLAVKRQYPQLDIRFLFMNATIKIKKGSRTTYGQWATKNNIIWAEGDMFPKEWALEPPKNYGDEPSV